MIVHGGSRIMEEQRYPAEQATWEPETNIPEFIRNYYKDPKKIGHDLPKPRIKHSKTMTNGQKYHLLTWDNDQEKEEWVEESVFTIMQETDSSLPPSTCNIW